MADEFNLGSTPQATAESDGLSAAIQNHNEYFAATKGKAMKAQFDAENTEIIHNVTDGTITATMSADVFKEKAEAAAKYDQISQLYMKQVQDLEQQRAQIKAHPFANTLAQIAGSMASADTNPVTRGLGQAALRLNPTDAELQAREQVPLRGALETQEGKSRYEMQDIQRQEAQARLLEQRGRNKEIERHDKATEDEKKDRDLDMNRKAALTDARLSISHTRKPEREEAFTARMQGWGIKDPAEIKRLYTYHREDAENLKAEYDRDLKVTTDAKKELIEARGVEQRKNMALNFEHKQSYFGITQQGKKDMADYRENLKKDDRLSLVTDKNKDKLAGLQQTEKYLDRVAGILSKPEYQSIPGFRSAALKDLPKYLKGADRTEFENLMAHETPRVLELMLRGGTGGASILRGPTGQKLVAALGISPQNTPEQAFRIMKNLNATVSENRLAIAAETPLMDWAPLHDLMGKDAAEVERRYHPRQAQGQAPSGGGQNAVYATNPQTKERKVTYDGGKTWQTVSQ